MTPRQRILQTAHRSANLQLVLLEMTEDEPPKNFIFKDTNEEAYHKQIMWCHDRALPVWGNGVFLLEAAERKVLEDEK